MLNYIGLTLTALIHGEDQRQCHLSFGQIISHVLAETCGFSDIIQHVIDELKGQTKMNTVIP